MSREWWKWFQDLAAFLSVITVEGTFFQVVSTDPGPTTGPVIVVNRRSPSPADNDNIGTYQFQGRNDAGEDIDYVQLKAVILDVSDGTEDGRFDFESFVNGSTDRRFSVHQGLFTPNATGGDKGQDTINGETLYQAGVQVPREGTAVADLSQTISNPPTQAEVQDISDKIDALLAVMRTAGQIST